MEIWLLIAVAVAFGDCPDPGAQPDAASLVSRAEEAIVEARMDDARAALDEVDVAFDCEIATQQTLGRRWLAEGALLTLTGDSDPGPPLRAWARLAPNYWFEDYGEGLKEKFAATIEEPIEGFAIIEVDPAVPDDHEGLLDGDVTRFPISIGVGMHLVQMGPRFEDGPPQLARYSQMVYLTNDQTLVLDHTVGRLPEIVGGDQLLTKRKRHYGWLVASGGAAILAGTSLGLALAENARYSQVDPEDPNAAKINDAIYNRQIAFTTVGATLLGVAALSFTFYWAF